MPSFVLLVCLSPFWFVFLFSDVFNHGVWQCLDELSDPSLRSLASRPESTVIASRAPGTTDAYRSVRQFQEGNLCFSCKVRACGVILTAFTGYHPFPLSGRLCHIWNTVGTPFGGFTFSYRQPDHSRS